MSCTTARSISTTAQATASDSQTQFPTEPRIATHTATAIDATTSSTNALPVSAPAITHATAATTVPSRPPRSAAETVAAARLRRVGFGTAAV